MKDIFVAKLKFIYFFLFIFSISLGYSQVINPDDWPGMVGYWTFDNASDIEAATVGNDLELFGTQVTVPGPEDGDNATRIGNDSYYTCTHDIAPNGGGAYVNEYSLVVDFKIPELGEYYCYYQTSMDNTDDGEVFVNPAGHVGISDTYYTYCILDPGQWYRLVIAVDLGNTFKYYIDGNLVLEGLSQDIDGRFSLRPFFHWFRDNDDEDNEFDIAAAAVFNYTLNADEVALLGGYGHVFPDIPIAGTDPYLQSPTPTSIYISWHADDTSESKVEYGTSVSLGEQTLGEYEDISGKIWHTVKLENLTPGTEYYYKCISGDDESEISTFNTLNTPENTEHIRLLLLGDSRTDVYRTSIISQTAEQQLITEYGEDWHKEIDFVLHVGDVVHTDAIDNYVNEFFTPYSNLSKKIPFMISVGNHEYIGDAINYFKYMKYEDFTGPPYEPPSYYNEKFYKFQIGNCLFISLNTNETMSNVEQLDWLNSVLSEAEANDTIDFIFPFGHHPGHSEIWPDGNTVYVQDDIFSVLKNYSKIAMYSYGHSHAYERGVLELDNTNQNYTNDMHLLLSGGAGSELDRWGMYDNQQDYPEIHMTLDHYVYSIVDINVANKSWQVKTYSLGHPDKPLNNVLIDEWYMNKNVLKPATPIAINVLNQGTPEATLVASDYVGDDLLMSSHFQVAKSDEDYTNPIIDKKRDWHNLYGDTGAPDYFPVDLNEGTELNKLLIGNTLDNSQTYKWRLRYRDFNLKWSDWSEDGNIPFLSTSENSIKNTLQIFPNPVTSYVKITYTLDQKENVSIRIYNSMGDLIDTVAEGNVQEAGTHNYLWKCDKVAVGMYHCILDFSGNHIAKPIFIINK